MSDETPEDIGILQLAVKQVVKWSFRCNELQKQQLVCKTRQQLEYPYKC